MEHVAPVAPTLAYSTIVHDPRTLRRYWPTGAVHLVVGVALLMLLQKLGRLVPPDLNQIARVLSHPRPEDITGLLILFGAYINTIAGVILIVLTGRWRLLLMGSLTMAVLVHLGGVLLGVACVVLDDREAQWGGLTTILGLVVGFPCLLMMILGLIALLRVKRLPRHPAPERALLISILESAQQILKAARQILKAANQILQRLLAEPKRRV